MKVGLGTVQFGIDYGISNVIGQTTVSEVKKILAFGSRHQVKMLDTAALYGGSEAVLGECLSAQHEFHIVTKTAKRDHQLSISENLAVWKQTFKNSLMLLRQSQVYGLLAHNAEDLLADDGAAFIDILQSWKAQGLVRKIGASVYTIRQVEELLHRTDIDLIQISLNVLDQRLLHNGLLTRLKQQGIEVHVRSVFLQGVLVMEPDTLPPYFDSVRELLREYRNYIKQCNLTPVEAALGFVQSLPEVDAIVCGVNNCAQLMEIVEAAQREINITDFARFAVVDEAIVNPALWKV